MGLMINIASGTDLKPPPWINLDVVAWPKAERPPDVYWDGTKDELPFADGSVSTAYAGYLFLHIPPRHHQRLIADIYRVMKPGGRLIVGEVDMRIAMKRWLENPQDVRCSEIIWGEMGSEHGAEFEQYDSHRWGWTEDKLTAFLSAAGFKDMRRISIHHSDVWWEMTIEARK